jgi:regulator of protease activity HflC (stomatin/prohibitin superfamily)
MLDDLFMADRGSGQILSTQALNEIFIKLNKATSGFGVYITDFQILKIEFPKEVLEHQKEHWKAKRQSIATIREGDTKASHIRSHEKERADALRNLILSISTKLDKNKDEQLIETLLLSLPGFLDEGLKDPVLRAYLANQKLDALDSLKKIANPPPE